MVSPIGGLRGELENYLCVCVGCDRLHHPLARTLLPAAREYDCYVVEDEQLDTLKTIVKGLYGDGQNVSPDRRRDLANQLHHLVGTIQSQCIELETYLCGVSAHL